MVEILQPVFQPQLGPNLPVQQIPDLGSRTDIPFRRLCLAHAQHLFCRSHPVKLPKIRPDALQGAVKGKELALHRL